VVQEEDETNVRDREDEIQVLADIVWPNSREDLDQIHSDAFADLQDSSHLHEEEELAEHVLKRVMHGDVTLEDVEVDERKNVSVFLSSTFSDTSMERDLLFAVLVPSLRSFCRELGLDFNLLELRQGVTARILEERQTLAVCLGEVRRCAKESFALSFIGIITNKYGFRPLPASISEDLFYNVFKRGSTAEQYYCLDENNFPPEFVQKKASPWTLWEDLVDPASLLSFTEREIVEGLNGDAMIIMRNLQGVPPGETRFVDQERRDEARSLIADLRARVQCSVARQVQEYNVIWRNGGIDPRNHPEHAEYLQEMLRSTHRNPGIDR